MVRVMEWGDYIWRIEEQGDGVMLERYAMPNSDFPHLVMKSTWGKMFTTQDYKHSVGAVTLGMIYSDGNYGEKIGAESEVGEYDPLRGCDFLMLLAHIAQEGKLIDWED